MTKIYDVQWELGAHTQFSGRISDTLRVGINYGMYAIQFFMGNPQGFKRSTISKEDLAKCHELLDKFPVHVFSHFPYVANLAGSVSQIAWDGNEEQDSKTTKILKSLEYELGILANFASERCRSGVVIHPGAFKNRAKGLEAISKSINKINFPKSSKLILENASGQGNALATTFRELKTIIDGVEEKKREHIGICVDTCHIFAYGDYNLSKIEEIDRLFSDFDKIIGLDKFTLLHLNDSETKFTGKVDRHACLGTGFIWQKNFDSLVHLLNTCKKHGIPAVLETHGRDMLTVAGLAREV
jgi:deoxyribonuclease-4